MKKKTGFLFFLTVMTVFASGENLWTPDFQGYIAEEPVLREGTLLRVLIDSSTSLKFSASHTGDNEIVLQFTDGETGDLFSFLPDVDTVSRRTAAGEEELSLQTAVAARVQQIDENGLALVSGSRTMRLQGSVQAVTVTGWVGPGSAGPDNSVRFDQLADAELTFRSFTETGGQILTEEDIERILPPAADPPPGETTPETAGTYSLTDEKKRELLLNYINQFLQLIFENE